MKWITCLTRLATAVVFLSNIPARPVAAQQETLPLYKADVRLVEVYATVLDRKGRHVGSLARESFEVLDEGVPQQIVSFETSSSALTCAILLDATGSMQAVLPALKNATIRLIGQLGDQDWYAVYGFNASLKLLQDFTRDKIAGKRAVMKIRAGGATALFDALSQVTMDLSAKKGKKAIIVFTDGDDNSSVLNANAAMARARRAGVPVYAVAEGEALQSRSLLDQLNRIAQITGGLSFAARKSRQIEDVFAAISKDVTNTYMLAYPAPSAGNEEWRTIQVSLKGLDGFRVRARQGYTLR